MPITYNVTALPITIYFNREGDHDHNGLMFALTENVPLLKYIQALASGDNPGPPPQAVLDRAKLIGATVPATQAEAQQPHPLVRPLVLRANRGDTVRLVLRNEIPGRWVGPHLVGDGYDVKTHDGSDVGHNPSSLTQPGDTRAYVWRCEHEGVFPFHDAGSYSGGEDGTNAHGLFGALVVEPQQVIWRDPVSGRTSRDGPLDGLYLDVVPAALPLPTQPPASATTLPNHAWPPPKARADFAAEAHREFVIFFHDEPEFVPPHATPPANPCGTAGSGGGGHGGHGDLPPLMPVSYRAEPMINREHTLFGLIARGHNFKGRPVLNEEQHHSSWMFGDPATPILRAYIGDPVRIRFVHAGVKETHVFHLHLYEWHAVPQDERSPRIDAISVSPQTAHTIEPLWGAGNRQQVAGDVIWHCHLYPHFHEGMWGMFRTFETLQNGPTGEALQAAEAVYKGRRIGHYPDGTPIERLLPLPDRPPPPRATPSHPGYPLYIPGEMKQKSPIPPWPDRALGKGEAPYGAFKSLRAADMPRDFDYRPTPTTLERNAFNPAPVPGELFTRNPFRVQQHAQWTQDPRFAWNGEREVSHEVVATRQRIDYNGYGWHDKDGHLYYLKAEGDPDKRLGPDGRARTKEPLFFRALHGQILNLTLENRTPAIIARTEFDPAFPPCAQRPWQGECSLHVHMVKFDPVCADGASVGWNYMSAPVFNKRMVYRWWLDEEFGTIFFHDHLFANYRQKHGLYGALLVEPRGARFFHNTAPNQPLVSGLQALVKLREPEDGKTWFREFCIGIGDFVPMWNRDGKALNAPAEPGGHGDQGVMGLNYRSDPIPERLKDPTDPARRRLVDPADWFSSLQPYQRDPYTTVFATYEGDPLWFRVVQGSHEEQHSFQVHGMRWQRFRGNKDSALRNQQTFGIAEAFTFRNHEPYHEGDYLYKLSGADDLWLGCWGIIRAFAQSGPLHPGAPPARLPDVPAEAPALPTPPPLSRMRRFHVVAEARRITYRDPDLVDPFGLVYRLESHTPPGGKPETVPPAPDAPQPLVLRCREGEWVSVTLENRLPKHYRPRPEPFAPAVPVEERNGSSHRPERPVSREVSMHADLLVYDVEKSDGANVGLNAHEGRQTVRPGERITYTWFAHRPPGSNGGEPLGPVLLQDMADFRNHRHHGLVGALVVEDAKATPLRVDAGAATAGGTAEAWHGPRATVAVRRPGQPEERFEEAVLLLQDGLRFFLRGNIHLPVPDAPPGVGEDAPDPEDQGQKAFNYRAEPVGPNVDPNYDPGRKVPPGDWLADPAPATPVFRVPAGARVRLHLVGACDKPRNHSFTVHGVSWPEWRFLPPGRRPQVASESAITAGTVRTFEFTPRHDGDHAYRSGVLKWAVAEGLWGILRVVGPAGADAAPAGGALAIEVVEVEPGTEPDEPDPGATP